jgi:hypothetical protein
VMSFDHEAVQHAVGLITAYDLGAQTEDFGEYASMVSGTADLQRTVNALCQINWLIFDLVERQGLEKSRVLAHYGTYFAAKAAGLLDDS